VIKTTIKVLNSIAGFMAFGGLTRIMVGEMEVALLAGVIGAFLNFYAISRLLNETLVK